MEDMITRQTIDEQVAHLTLGGGYCNEAQALSQNTELKKGMRGGDNQATHKNHGVGFNQGKKSQRSRQKGNDTRRKNGKQATSPSDIVCKGCVQDNYSDS